MRRCLALLLPAITCAFTACGGGGGGSAAPPPPPPPPPSNTAPTFTVTAFNATEDTDLAAAVTATDAQSQTITFALVTNPAHGTVSGFSGSGAFIYLGAANFSGADTFTVRATDSAGAQTTATVTVTVAPVNDAPTIREDVLTVSGSAPLIDVLANDVEPDGEALTLTLVGTPDFGTAAVENGRIRLTLPAGFQGFNTFSYRALDGAGLGTTVRALVFVDAQPVRVVYVTNEDGEFKNNLYVDDLLTRRRLTSFNNTGATYLGQWAYTSKNGRTILYDEMDLTTTSPTRKFWTAAAVDGSSAPRRINPPLSAGQTIELASDPSADGRWATYRIRDAGAGERFYIVDVTGNAAPREIVAPAGAARIDSYARIEFDEQSQYLFVPVWMQLAGGQQGMTIYRAPVTDPAALQPFFSEAEAGRTTYAVDVAPDGSRAMVVVYESMGRRLYLARASDPANPVPLTPTIQDPDLSMGDPFIDWERNRVLFSIDSQYGITPFVSTIYITNIATGTWSALGSLSGSTTGPGFRELHPSGTTVLYTTEVSDPVTIVATEVRELDLLAGAPTRLLEHSKTSKVLQYTNAGESVVLVADRVQLYARNDLTHPQTLFSDVLVSDCRFSPDGKIIIVSIEEGVVSIEEGVWAANQPIAGGTFVKRLVQLTSPPRPHLALVDVIPRY